MSLKQHIVILSFVACSGCTVTPDAGRAPRSLDLLVAHSDSLAFDVVDLNDQSRVLIELPPRPSGGPSSLIGLSIAPDGTFACLGSAMTFGTGKIDASSKRLISFKWIDDVSPYTFHIATNPKGTSCAYVQRGGGQMNPAGPIKIVDLTSDKVRIQAPKALDTGLHWTSDGHNLIFAEIVNKDEISSGEWEAFPESERVYGAVTMISSLSLATGKVTRIAPGFPLFVSPDDTILGLVSFRTSRSPAGLVEFSASKFNAITSNLNVKMYGGPELLFISPILYWEPDRRSIYINATSHESDSGDSAFIAVSDLNLGKNTEKYRNSLSSGASWTLTVWAH